jgi:enoyl-CoA hydratase/carnithine racemase
MNTKMTELFTIPISTGGTFVCSTPTTLPPTSADDRDKQNNNNNGKKIYLLTFTSPPDNRLTPAFIEAFILSLDIIEHRYEKGVVITTSGIGKFFSNGLDLEKVMSTDRFWERYLWRLFRRLLT